MNIKGFCTSYNLGETLNITKLTGGLMHKMYKVETTKGIYAIKILNREVISRPEAYANFIKSETISNYLALNNIKVSNALKINNNYLNKYEDDYYMVFNFIDGHILKDEEITIKHCKKIANVLAKIHNLDYTKLNLIPEINQVTQLYDWSSYLNNSKIKQMPYYELYLNNYSKYNSLQKDANDNFNKFNKDFTLSHQDLDSKNVMWQDDEPILIDFEAATLANPYQELLEVSLCWSGFISNNFNEEKFITFFSSYIKERSLNNVSWNEIIIGNLVNRLNWLHYNLERSLGIITNDSEEIKLATNEVIKTIKEINRYLSLSHKLNTLINSIINPQK